MKTQMDLFASSFPKKILKKHKGERIDQSHQLFKLSTKKNPWRIDAC